MGVLRALKGSKHRCIDAHLHVVDFLQDTAGLDTCIKYMDRANVAHAVIFGLPVTKIWADIEKVPPGYYLGDDSKCYYYGAVDFILGHELSRLGTAQRARFFPLIGGFNPVDLYAYKHVERVIRYFPGLWHGIGEVLFRHDDLTGMTYGDTPRCNHAAMDRIYDLCVEHGMPVCIHQNLTSVGTSTYPQWLHELQDMLKRHPKTKIVWAHCGVSRRVYTPVYHQVVRRLLASYPNLHVDFSWIVYDEFICPGGRPDEDWLALAERYSDRICIGTDIVNKFEYLPPQIQKYDVFLDRLSEKARRDLAFDTAYRLYGKAKV